MHMNLHAHTTRCGHATGTPREYIEAAIAGGIRIMGFSEHVPLRFPDGHETPHRVPTAQAPDYIAQLRQLREEYRDKITLHIGFEAEFYPRYFDEMLKNVRELGAEYLILGQHFLANEDPGCPYSGARTEDEEILKEYVDTVIQAMETGLFTYVAHPDLIRYEGDDGIYTRHIRRLCLRAKELNVPLEINFLGIREKRHYPRERFWEIAGEVGGPVVLGFDAHDVAAASDLAHLPEAMALVERCGLKLIDEPKVIRI